MGNCSLKTRNFYNVGSLRYGSNSNNSSNNTLVMTVVVLYRLYRNT